MIKQLAVIQKLITEQRLFLFLTLSVSISFGNVICAYSQSNSFFGANPGAPNSAGGGTDYTQDLPEDSNPNAVLPGLNSTNPNTNPPIGTDFSGDEKRMQKKYKDNLNSAKKLIDKGDQMMKSAGKNVDNAEYKKGKILKETGEKWQAQLKANNPFAPAAQKSK